MRIGVDLGGTKIEAILLDHKGVEVTRRRILTPQQDYHATLQAVVRLVQSIEEDHSITAHIGVGIPGTISPATGFVKNANSVCLIGQPLKEDLERRLDRSIRLANDADCFTVSEATDGSATGADLVFGVILGTGVGGGVCWHGEILRGPNAIVGEWGHNPLPWPEDDERPGESCYCGRRGCIETFLSGSGLQRTYFQTGGKNMKPEEISELFQAGDTQCEHALNRYTNQLARSLASVINILDPDVIVLGGGLSNVRLLYDDVPKIWGNWIFSDRVDTKLMPAKHGDSSGVRGAAWLWSRDVTRSS